VTATATVVIVVTAGGCMVRPADDGKSEPIDESTQPLVVNYPVPYLAQRNYPNIGESACGPTSLAMLLRYYFPNSGVDMRELYSSGLQSYGYQGPATGYCNVSFAKGYTQDPGLGIVPTEFKGYFSGSYSGNRGLSTMQAYVDRVWNVASTYIMSVDQLYSALSRGPVLGHVYRHGNTSWGHYVVIRGIDDRGTTSRADDIILLNDLHLRGRRQGHSHAESVPLNGRIHQRGDR
jgi:hypothetical protein